MRVLTVVGARPQFIKAAVLSRLIRQAPGLEEILVHTGQHYDPGMSEIFFDELDLPRPDHALAVGSGSHGAQTGRMLEAVEALIRQHRPEAVLVYGDTNSTLAGALAASKLHVPVAHVEAGLRSFNRRMPEEQNRVLTDHLATWLFAPTRQACRHLAREGIVEGVHQVGDVMVEAARYYARKAETRLGLLARLGVVPGDYVLATIHRAENTDDPRPLRAIFEALVGLTGEMPVVVPLHPRTRKALAAAGLLPAVEARLCVTEPLGYLDMVVLERHARLVVADSGGVQKEAFFHGVPCVVPREETEWGELVEAGWNHLAPPSSAEAIREAVDRALAAPPPAIANPYGDGDAGRRILEILRRALAGAAAA